MRTSKCTDWQIAVALRQHEAGTPVADIGRKLGVGDTTFLCWQMTIEGLATSKLRELRQLRNENRKLRTLVADLTLDRHMRQEVVWKKL